jgi:hypothetical protein
VLKKLRHGLNYLWPSEIADQFYCEYKVHLKRLHPEVQIDLPSLELGEVSHAALVSQSEPITAVEIEKSIRTNKKVAICEWMLEGCFQNVTIRGRPDFFAFEGMNALLLLDFKFSAARKPFRDHEVQAEIYALLAESMKFSTEQLCFGIVIFPSAALGSSLRDAALTKAAMLRSFTDDGILQKIYEQCEQARKMLLVGQAMTTTIESDACKTFLFRYDPKKAERNLNWALQYWLDEREPIPEKHFPRKCFACSVNAAGLCEHALQIPDHRFKVQRHSNGQVLVYR